MYQSLIIVKGCLHSRSVLLPKEGGEVKNRLRKESGVKKSAIIIDWSSGRMSKN